MQQLFIFYFRVSAIFKPKNSGDDPFSKKTIQGWPKNLTNIKNAFFLYIYSKSTFPESYNFPELESWLNIIIRCHMGIYPFININIISFRLWIKLDIKTRTSKKTSVRRTVSYIQSLNLGRRRAAWGVLFGKPPHRFRACKRADLVAFYKKAFVAWIWHSLLYIRVLHKEYSF